MLVVENTIHTTKYKTKTTLIKGEILMELIEITQEEFDQRAYDVVMKYADHDGVKYFKEVE